MNLYEITEEMDRLDDLMMECVDEETGEIVDSEELEALEKEIEDKFEDKVENIIKYALNIKAEIDGLKAEEKRLKAMRKIKENKIARLTKFTKDMMEKTGKLKITTPIKKIAVKKGTVSFDLDPTLTDFRSIPKEFLKIDVSLKKADFKKYAKTHDEIPEGIIEVVKDTTLKIV